jgi:membrane protein YdbS with pleckstrin-like domain
MLPGADQRRDRRGVTMRYPTRLLTDGEEIIDQFRPHWRVLIPSILWAMLLAALAGVAFAALEQPWGWISLGVAALVWLIVSIRSLVTWYFTNYVLTNERIIVRRGMIARTGAEIPLENITNVLFSQTVLERILRYGDVTLESAGTQGRSKLDDIPDPEGFQSEVYAARELRTAHIKSGGPAGSVRDIVAQLEALADLRERGHLSDEEFEAKKARLLHEAAGD